MIAGSSDPLFDDWSTTLRDPNRHVAANVKIVAARAASLVEDWPIATGMVRARLLGTHGPKGLRFASLFQRDDEPDTDDAERDTRRQIESAISRRQRRIDAGGIMTRRRLDRAVDWMAVVLGNGWAVRVKQSDGHRWRLVHPFRIRNPKGKTNDERWQDGVELDAQGRPAAVWVDTARQTELVMPTTEPIRIPWTTPDGTPNVAHRKGYDIPGSIHGLSYFAPLMLPARMLQGVAEAYVAAKRVQASIPLLMEVEDVAKAKEAYAGSRLANLVMPKGSSVTFPAWKFEGADYQIFTDTEVRDMCSAWGIPWELVLGDHSAKSGASARSLWQQFYQQAEDWQGDFAEEFARPVDESIVREEAIAGTISGLTDDWERNMAGSYRGPPRVMPDPLKEADAAEKWNTLGRSKSSSFAEQGWDYREETMQKSQDEALADAQGIDDQQDAAPAPAAPAPAAPSDDPADDASPDDAKPTKAQLAGDDMRASDVLQIISALQSREQQPVQIIQRMEVGADSAKILGEAIAQNMPQQQATVVNVAPAAVTVEAARVDVPAAVVNFTAPAQPPATVIVQASQPSVHVHVPEAKRHRQRVTEQADGSVIMEDVE